MIAARADSCVLVIFGASGDLTHRKLLPAIYNLAESGHLPERFTVVGVARGELDEATFRSRMRDQVRHVEGEPLEPEKWAAIEQRLHYVSGEFTDKETFTRLRQHLEHITAAAGAPPNYLFYLAVPPDLFATVVDQLGAAGLTDEATGWRRVIIARC